MRELLMAGKEAVPAWGALLPPVPPGRGLVSVAPHPARGWSLRPALLLSAGYLLITGRVGASLRLIHAGDSVREPLSPSAAPRPCRAAPACGASAAAAALCQL